MTQLQARVEPNTTAGNSHQLISLTGTINGTTESANYTYVARGFVLVTYYKVSK